MTTGLRRLDPRTGFESGRWPPRVFRYLEGTPASFFIKDRRFATQAEYRLIWHSSQEIAPYIDIACPEAVQFCTRIT